MKQVNSKGDIFRTICIKLKLENNSKNNISFQFPEKYLQFSNLTMTYCRQKWQVIHQWSAGIFFIHAVQNIPAENKGTNFHFFMRLLWQQTHTSGHCIHTSDKGFVSSRNQSSRAKVIWFTLIYMYCSFAWSLANSVPENQLFSAPNLGLSFSLCQIRFTSLPNATGRSGYNLKRWSLEVEDE